jgi:hypothetical protein
VLFPPPPVIACLHITYVPYISFIRYFFHPSIIDWGIYHRLSFHCSREGTFYGVSLKFQTLNFFFFCLNLTCVYEWRIPTGQKAWVRVGTGGVWTNMMIYSEMDTTEIYGQTKPVPVGAHVKKRYRSGITGSCRAQFYSSRVVMVGRVGWDGSLLVFVRTGLSLSCRYRSMDGRMDHVKVDKSTSLGNISFV